MKGHKPRPIRSPKPKTDVALMFRILYQLRATDSVEPIARKTGQQFYPRVNPTLPKKFRLGIKILQRAVRHQLPIDFVIPAFL